MSLARHDQVSMIVAADVDHLGSHADSRKQIPASGTADEAFVPIALSGNPTQPTVNSTAGPGRSCASA